MNCEIKDFFSLRNQTLQLEFTCEIIFSTNSGIVNSYPFRGAHKVVFVDEFYFDSYSCHLQNL